MNTEPSEGLDKRVLIGIGVFFAATLMGTFFYHQGYNAGLQTQTSKEVVVAETADQVDSKPKDPIVLNGTGQQVTDLVELVSGLTTFKLSHQGKSNFIVRLLDEDANTVESLVNEIGNFEGSKAVQIPADGKYLLDINADGPWTITIQQK